MVSEKKRFNAKRWRWGTVFLCLSVLVGGCTALGKQEKKQAAKTAPAGPHKFDHAAFGIAADNSESMGSSQTLAYEAVVIEVKNKSDNTSKLLTIPLGGDKVPLELDNEGLMILATKFYSDFAVGNYGVFSRSEKMNNPAVAVIITKGGDELFRGHLFAKFPEVHAFEHPVIKIRLVEAKP